MSIILPNKYGSMTVEKIRVHYSEWKVIWVQVTYATY